MDRLDYGCVANRNPVPTEARGWIEKWGLLGGTAVLFRIEIKILLVADKAFRRGSSLEANRTRGSRLPL